MCPPVPQRTHHRQMQRFHLTPCLPGFSPFLRLFLAPCAAPVTSRLVDFLYPFWLPGAVFLAPGRLSWVRLLPFKRVRTSLFCGPLSDPYVRSSRGTSARRHGWRFWHGDRDVLLPLCSSTA